MSTLEPTPGLEAMLAHRRFVRGLVRSLLRGEAAADDVVQETFVRAWQGGGPRGGSLRGWLLRIARNLAIDHRRAAARRERDRAREAATVGTVPTPEEVLLREEQRQRVVRSVLALPQPYRGVVLLRYWEELEPAAIAERLGLPGATVRSQLKRGLQMLRERLDADYGDRAAWTAALLPFALPAAAPAAKTTLLGALLMTKTQISLSLAALVALFVLGWAWFDGPPPPVSPPTQGSASREVLAPAVGSTDAAAGAGAAATSPAREEVAAAGDLVVTGQVTTREEPYGGLPLELQWFAGPEANGDPVATHALQCDGQGRFTWRGPRRTATSCVRAVTLAHPMQWFCTPEVVAPTRTEVELRVSVLPLDRTLSGRVHDVAGNPIAGAHLDINGFKESAAESDAMGVYRMHVPSRPGYPLIVRAAGFAQGLFPNYMPPDATTGEFDVELQPGAQLRGRVVDERGAPIAGASVRAGAVAGRVRTGDDGRFVVDGLRPETNVMVMITAAGYQTLRDGRRVSDDEAEFVLKAGLVLAVRVLGPDGRPVAGARIAVAPDRMQGLDRRGVTDADGAARLGDLPETAIEVVVESPGLCTARVAVEARRVTGPFVIHMQRGYTLRGRVVDDLGAPVAGATVYCQQSGVPLGLVEVGTRGKADADGRYEIADLPPEEFRVYAHHADYNRAEAVAKGGATQELELRLARSPSLAGRVVDDATGLPIGRFTVTVTADRMPPLEGLVFVDAEGRFCVRNWQLVPGVAATVFVRAPDHAEARLAATPVVGMPPDTLLVRLARGARVEGVVRDRATGEPIAGAAVTLQRAGVVPKKGTADATTDAAGAFALVDVPAGGQSLVIRHAEHLEIVFEFEAPTSGVQRIEPVLERGVAVRGRVVGDAAKGKLMLNDDSGHVRECELAADGTFAFANAAPGPSYLTLITPDQHMRTRTLVVPPGGLDGCELLLRAGTGAIRVAVQSETGATTGEITVARIGGDSEDLLRFRDGTRLVDGLAAGRYRVTASAKNGAERGVAEVDVGDGEVAVTIECRKE